ncbi:MAG: SDR family oxidoreductase [Myxococcales bacterium]|nr:SDR family oxidoreductase [Myxococcales bacterium]
MPHSYRAAIVTGSARGIGAAIAERLAQDGFGVVINYSGEAGPAEELRGKITAAGGRAIACKADVADAAAVAAMFDEADRAFAGIDVLVNNAGVMKLAPIGDCDDDLVDKHLAINLKGVINTLRQAAKRLGAGGRVINISSSVVGLYQPTYGVYAATKAGVEALTHIFAKEMGARGITVNAVAPGPVATSLFLDDKDEKTIEGITKMIPLGRLAEPADIARVVSFLAGPDGGWVSGQVLRANGGMI